MSLFGVLILADGMRRVQGKRDFLGMRLLAWLLADVAPGAPLVAL
jgi:hypothetical protein